VVRTGQHKWVAVLANSSSCVHLLCIALSSTSG
jgi:hypothetical protein